MKFLKNIFVVVFLVKWNLSNALYVSNSNQHQSQGYSHHALPNINTILPETIIEDFEYVPTVQGYRFSYQLLGGSTHEEIAFLTGISMDEYSRLDSKNTDLNAVGVGGRPKMKLKNRKLSPGALKSLSG